MDKLIKQFFIGFLVIFAVAVNASSVGVFNNNKDSVVLVKSFDHNGEIMGFGSGVAIKENVVITNKHVIEDSQRLAVFKNGVKIEVIEAYYSNDLDVAFLTTVSGFQPVKTAEEAPVVGERVYAIGNPLGFEESISDGIVSSLRGDLIQVTAAISPGSSGGALLNEKGDLIGITSHKIKGGENLNFAVSIQSALNSSIVKFEFTGHAPALNSAYAMREALSANTYELFLIRLDDLEVYGDKVYATTLHRRHHSDYDAWLEITTRAGYDCNNKYWKLISSKVRNQREDNNIVDSFVFNDSTWEDSKNEVGGRYLPDVCFTAEKYAKNLTDDIYVMHTKIMKRIPLNSVRVKDLFNPEYSDNLLTPLGEFLKVHNGEFSLIHALPSYWVAYKTFAGDKVYTLDRMMDFMNDPFKSL
ncbi:S1C family serine protease [Alteromonas macleodii]|uniref:S1C family serine protease n=1 Tax=Alteromonas macleodii TaxID=28108 RepID=UPI003D006728